MRSFFCLKHVAAEGVMLSIACMEEAAVCCAFVACNCSAMISTLYQNLVQGAECAQLLVQGAECAQLFLNCVLLTAVCSYSNSPALHLVISTPLTPPRTPRLQCNIVDQQKCLNTEIPFQLQP